MKPMPPKVSVVVLSWNNYCDTARCLMSLRRQSYSRSDYDVTIVDNGSTDDSPTRLSGNFPEVRMIRNQFNLGYAAGVNVGIRHALARGIDYVLILNNDLVLHQDAIAEAVRAGEADTNVGVVGGKMYLQGREEVLWYAGGTVHPFWGVRVRGFRERDVGQANLPSSTRFVTGAMMLIKRRAIEVVGLLPEDYFFGEEEYDYSLSISKGGFLLFYEPRFIAWHKSDGSHSNSNPRHIYNGTRNRFTLLRRHGGRWARWLTLIYACYALSAGFVRWWLIHEKYNGLRGLLAYALATYLALVDNLRGRPLNYLTLQEVGIQLRFLSESRRSER